MRYIPLLLLTTSLFGVEVEEPAPDLFRKDVQVFSINADFLYWWPEEGALEMAYAMQDNAASTSVYASGNAQFAKYSAAPGFRVTTSFFRALHYWEILTTYTHLRASGKNSVSKPSPEQHFLTGVWPQFFSAPMASAKSSIALNYNTAGFLATRVFIPNPHLRLRLLGGATAAWIDQTWNVSYSDAQDQVTQILNHWGFAGGGIKMGTTVDWYWTGELYFTAGMSMCGLMGSYHNQAKQTVQFQPDGGTDPSLPLRNMQKDDIRMVTNGQFFLGPSIQHNYTNARLEVFLGYEVNGWMNLQEIYHSTAGSAASGKETWYNSGTLALHGLIFRTTVDF